MTRPVIILDVETTSLIPGYESGAGVIWELAVVDRAAGLQRVYRVEPDPLLADPRSLKVGRFAERTAGTRQPTPLEVRGRLGLVYPGESEPLKIWDLTGSGRNFWSDPADLARFLSAYLDGATLIAANPAFDAGFLSALLAYYGQAAQPWHYRLRDIGSIAYGYLCSSDNPGFSVPPIDAGTDDFASALGVNPDDFVRHSALGDCLLVSAMLDVIEGRPS